METENTESKAEDVVEKSLKKIKTLISNAYPEISSLLDELKKNHELMKQYWNDHDSEDSLLALLKVGEETIDSIEEQSAGLGKNTVAFIKSEIKKLKEHYEKLSAQLRPEARQKRGMNFDGASQKKKMKREEIEDEKQEKMERKCE